MKSKKRIFSCDFETTVYEGQTDTEVWASASVELYTEDVNIFHSIEEQFDYFNSLNCHIIAYYHNLKFDGSFWLDLLLRKLEYKQAYEVLNGNEATIKWLKNKDMPKRSFKYMISEQGQWYSITIKNEKGYIIELRDSYKLLPFKVAKIGKDFKTKHQKLDMEYEGYRYAGCEITDEEKKYIANDVLVVKEALEILYDEGHNKLTIGSCCLTEFKATYSEEEYNYLFPKLDDIELDEKVYGSPNAEKYIRKSYKGGWCYLVKGKEDKVKHKGTTADVNSLYPSMMSSESGNKYPYGVPHFWKGDYIPNDAIADDKYFFVRIKTRFYIKKDKLPFIQIKGSYMYRGTEALTTSDYKAKDGNYYTHYTDIHGVRHDTRQILTLTMTDYQLIKEHYNLVDYEVLDGCWFYAKEGLFDEYIEKYKKQKIVSTGARRQLAKLFLNNLYGKFAMSDDSSFKKAFVKQDGSIGFIGVEAHDKETGYIPVGSAITSYARNFTIRAAQKNYHGVDEAGFIYADTDSIHCDLPPDKIEGISVHPTNFCCWALESCWDDAIFVRQKTYIEHVTHKDLEPIDEPYYDVKCAGMPDRCKDYFVASMIGMTEKQKKEWSTEEKEWCSTPRKLEDFKIGLEIPFGKLRPKRIKGGTLLVETSYKMR